MVIDTIGLCRAFAFLGLLSVGAMSPVWAQDEFTKDQAATVMFGPDAAYLSPAFPYAQGYSCSFGAHQELISCCGGLPLGTFRLDFNSGGFLQLLQRFERAGMITIKPVNTGTGDVMQDLHNFAMSGPGSTVKTEVAPGVDKDQLSTIYLPKEQRTCFKYGKPTLKEVVRFDKFHAPGRDGIGFDAYVLQGTYSYDPSRLELALVPDLQRQRKFQAVFRFDPFTKRPLLVAAEGTGLLEPFNAGYFASQLGMR